MHTIIEMQQKKEIRFFHIRPKVQEKCIKMRTANGFMSIDQLHSAYFTPDMQYKFVDVHRCYDVCNKYLFHSFFGVRFLVFCIPKSLASRTNCD